MKEELEFYSDPYESYDDYTVYYPELKNDVNDKYSRSVVAKLMWYNDIDESIGYQSDDSHGISDNPIIVGDLSITSDTTSPKIVETGDSYSLMAHICIN